MKNRIMIVGATSGIGYACAKRFDQEDNALYLVGRDEEKLNRVCGDIHCEKHNILYDLRNLENIGSIF